MQKGLFLSVNQPSIIGPSSSVYPAKLCHIRSGGQLRPHFYNFLHPRRPDKTRHLIEAVNTGRILNERILPDPNNPAATAGGCGPSVRPLPYDPASAGNDEDDMPDNLATQSGFGQGFSASQLPASSGSRVSHRQFYPGSIKSTSQMVHTSPGRGHTMPNQHTNRRFNIGNTFPSHRLTGHAGHTRKSTNRTKRSEGRGTKRKKRTRTLLSDSD